MVVPHKTRNTREERTKSAEANLGNNGQSSTNTNVLSWILHLDGCSDWENDGESRISISLHDYTFPFPESFKYHCAVGG